MVVPFFIQKIWENIPKIHFTYIDHDKVKRVQTPEWRPNYRPLDLPPPSAEYPYIQKHNSYCPAIQYTEHSRGFNAYCVHGVRVR